MKKSTLRAVEAISKNETAIFGDYDVDGATSTAIWWGKVLQN